VSDDLREDNYRKLVLRRCLQSDSALLLSWRNNELVRIYSRSKAPISNQEHEDWLREKLTVGNTSCRIYMFTENDTPIGMTRIDQLDESSVEISILVDPKLVSKGYGASMLKETLSESATNQKIDKYFATIHNQNIASIALFEKFGFSKTQHDIEFSTYALPILIH